MGKDVDLPSPSWPLPGYNPPSLLSRDPSLFLSFRDPKFHPNAASSFSVQPPWNSRIGIEFWYVDEVAMGYTKRSEWWLKNNQKKQSSRKVNRLIILLPAFYYLLTKFIKLFYLLLALRSSLSGIFRILINLYFNQITIKYLLLGTWGIDGKMTIKSLYPGYPIYLQNHYC